MEALKNEFQLEPKIHPYITFYLAKKKNNSDIGVSYTHYSSHADQPWLSHTFIIANITSEFKPQKNKWA